MLIKTQVIEYLCDRCKKQFTNLDGYNLFPEKYDIYGAMLEEGWGEINGKWYCPDCIKIINSR